jgi:hypothetical protein
MNRHIIRLAFLPLLAVSVYGILFRRDWVGEWNWTIDMVNGTATLSGPLLAGVGAVGGIGVHRMRAVTAAYRDTSRLLVRGALETWGVGCAALGIGGAVAVVLTMRSVHGGHPTVWALALGPAVLLAASAVGVGIGYAVPYLITALLLPPLYFCIGALAPATAQIFFRQGPVTGSLAGLDYSPATASATILGTVGLAGCAMTMAIAARARRVAATIVAGGVVLAGLGLSHLDDGYRWEPRTEQASACATEDGFLTCVAPSNRVRLAALSYQVATGARLLSEAGAAVPARFDALIPYQNPTRGHGFLPAISANDPATAIALLLYPEPCPAWFDPTTPPSNTVGLAQALIAAIMARETDPSAPIPPEFKAWYAAAENAGAKSWVAVTYGQLRRCELDQIELPA